jgi:hypothetical protein
VLQIACQQNSEKKVDDEVGVTCTLLFDREFSSHETAQGAQKEVLRASYLVLGTSHENFIFDRAFLPQTAMIVQQKGGSQTTNDVNPLTLLVVIAELHLSLTPSCRRLKHCRHQVQYVRRRA